MRMITDLDDPQRKRVKVEEELAVLHVATRRCVGVAEQEMSPGVFAGVSSDPVEHVDPVDVLRVILVHQAHLAEVDGLDPDVDVAAGQEIEPHPRLEAAHVRDRATAPPVVHEPPVGIEHFRIPEIAVLHGLTELDEDVLRDGEGFHASGHDLEHSGLQDDFGVGLVKHIGK